MVQPQRPEQPHAQALATSCSFPKTDLVGKTSRPSCKQGIPAPPSSTHGKASLPPTSSRELLARRHCTQACRQGQHLLTLVGKWKAAYREHVVLQKLGSRGAQLTLANCLGMGCCLHAEGQGRDATCMCTLGEGAARHKPGCESVAPSPAPGLTLTPRDPVRARG